MNSPLDMVNTTTLAGLIGWLELIGVVVFAVTGALEASRRQMDIVSFILIATFTGIGGGTLRDLLIGATPVLWVREPVWVLTCIGSAVVVFFTAHLVERRYVLLLWLDALGLALFCVTGSALALKMGISPPVAVILGMISATFGGLVRDVVCNQMPLILRHEIYATAALLGSSVYVGGMTLLDIDRAWAALAGFSAAFLLRALALRFKFALPVYKARPGREY